MYECEIIEVNDFGFNHYIHHIDEYEVDTCDYKNELDFIFSVNDSMYKND